MKLSDYLRVPYIVAASSEDRDDGTWDRIAECPELPDCRVGAPTIVEALDALARRRVNAIVELLNSGMAPPVPRPPLDSVDVEEELKTLGLFEELAAVLDLNEDELKGNAFRQARLG